MKRKLTALVLSALVATSLFTGCKSETAANNDSSTPGTTAEQTEKNTEAPKGDENVVITLGCWGSSPSETKLLDDQIQAFQNKYPNITIKKQVQVGDYLQSIQSKIASKSAPDVYYLDVALADQFISKGVIDPIDEYLDKEDVKDFYPNILAGYQKDGKTYGLPKDFNSLVLFYNQDMFDKAGVKPPTTWDELKEVAPKLTNDKQVALCLENDAQRFNAFMYQAGGKVNDGDNPAFNTPEAAKGLDFYYSFHKAGWAKTPKDLGVDWAGPALSQQKAAMIVAGGWVIPFMKDNAPNVKYGMVKLPKGEKEGGPIFTVAYVLNKDSKHKKEAAEVIKYLTGAEAQKMTSDSGLAIPTRQSMAGEFTKTFPERQALVDMANISTVANYGLNGSKILDVLVKAGEKIQFGQVPDAATALKEAEASLK